MRCNSYRWFCNTQCVRQCTWASQWCRTQASNHGNPHEKQYPSISGILDLNVPNKSVMMNEFAFDKDCTSSDNTGILGIFNNDGEISEIRRDDTRDCASSGSWSALTSACQAVPTKSFFGILPTEVSMPSTSRKPWWILGRHLYRNQWLGGDERQTLASRLSGRQAKSASQKTATSQ